MRLATGTTIRASREVVWAYLEDIDSHTEWMADAVSIDFLTTRRRGVGTRFACRTRVGPLRTTDLMEVTEWSAPETMGIRHSGAVTGEGRFELTVAGAAGESTRMVWRESLRFPWWLGGPLGARLARPLLRRIWRRNLDRLAVRVAPGGD